MISPCLLIMKKNSIFNSLSFIFFLLCTQWVSATEIEISVDRSPVGINESFQLSFTATESPDGDPDFSPLENDFKIINRSKQSNRSWVNGKSTKSIQWILNLIPKRKGNIEIPVISFGDDLSKAAVIQVSKSTLPGNTNNADFFIETEVSTAMPYVQSQVIFTLRIFLKVQIYNPSLSKLEFENALIEQLGKETSYNTEINGVNHKVIEIKYAIFPQKSGISIIKPSVLTAEVATGSRSRFNSFFNRPRTKTKRVTSKAITIDVQAAPDTFTGKQWLPAESVAIQEKWSGDTSNMKVGEPLTRTISILAKGSTVAQLPELHSEQEIAQLKTYPDQPTLNEQKEADGITAFRQEKIAFIPSKSGSFTLPAIEIPWFNTQTQQMEIARIPEKTVTAIPLAKSITSETSKASIPVHMGTGETPVIQYQENKFWMWLSLILGSGWLITAVFLLRKLMPKKEEVPIDRKEIKLKRIVKVLKQACAENNQLETKEALLSWGEIKYNSNSLMEIASHCEARLRDQIQLLNQSLYAKNSEPWHGKKLFQYFVENSAREKVAQKTNDGDDGLEPLYRL